MANKKVKKQASGGLVNRRARFDYELGDEIVAGLSLTGIETRAARDGHVQLRGSYINLVKNELWLVGASFSLKLNQKGETDRTVDSTPRKLLVSRKQIDSLSAARKNGLTIVPIKLLTNGRYIKLVIALGKGKKRYDKRQSLKKKAENRDAQRAIKSSF